jgi:hypothetical protein
LKGGQKNKMEQTITNLPKVMRTEYWKIDEYLDKFINSLSEQEVLLSGQHNEDFYTKSYKLAKLKFKDCKDRGIFVYDEKIHWPKTLSYPKKECDGIAICSMSDEQAKEIAEKVRIKNISPKDRGLTQIRFRLEDILHPYSIVIIGTEAIGEENSREYHEYSSGEIFTEFNGPPCAFVTYYAIRENMINKFRALANK